MRLFLSSVILIVLLVNVFADGMIMPPRPDDPYPLILNHYVDVEIDDTYATVSVDQEFVNDGHRDIQGIYMFPLPSGSIKKFQMVVDGKTIEGKLLDSDEAKDIYHQYVIERREVSLLEYSGKEMFTASVMLKRGEKVRIQISYDQVIKQSSGVYSFFYPLSTERYTTKPIDPVDINVKIMAAGDIGFVLSPTHDVEVDRISKREVEVSYYSEEIPDRDFEIFYGVTERDYDVKVIGDKENYRDGYFMLFVYPSNPKTETVPKDVVYVIDVSGSMSGTKIEQAKRALKYGVGQLNDGDRFNIITFSSDADYYKDQLVGTGFENDAEDFVDDLEAVGATNIEDPLVLASGMFEDDNRLHIVVLLTDGEDTTGHSVKSVMRSIEGCDCKIFPFGVGKDIDFELLDRISNEHGDGIPTYIRSDAELESSLTIFYDKIAKPLLTNVDIDVRGVGTYDIYPKEMADVFYGSQIVIVGKYKDSGSAVVTLSGETAGKNNVFEYEVSFPGEERNSFVERTWATRKVGHLLDVIALEGETSELKEEIVGLATKYGIPTPYTSYITIDDEGKMKEMRIDVDQAPGGWAEDANIMTAAAEYKSVQSYSHAPPQTRNVGDKTFVSIDGLWKDTECSGDVDRTIEFGSDDYLEVISENELAKYLSVGDRVWVCADQSIMVTTEETSAQDKGVVIIGNAGTQSGGDNVPTATSVLDRVLPFALLLLLAIGVVLSIMFRRHSHPGESEVTLYKTLSSDTRLDIMRLLKEGEGGRTTTFISEKIGKSKATVSEHLDKLVNAELIEKDHAPGRKWVFYKLTSKGKTFLKKGG